MKRPIENSLYYGDCLEIMYEWPSSFIDLCYLDPPFNSSADYNILFGQDSDHVSTIAFEDTWHWDVAAQERIEEIGRASQNPARDAIRGLYAILGDSGMMAYLSYMAERLIEIKRVLKDTGSIYLHCDPTAAHYLKIMMDSIFGAGNFRNEIIWRIGWISGYKSQKRGWIRNHDTLLYYTMSSKSIERFNKEYIPYAPDYVRRDGKKPTGKGIPIEDTWNCSNADVLDSIMIKSFSKEKLGYPTQKPIALLERIINASSNKGEIVLDPFCGCGTSVMAAENLGRKWIGIDISPFAIDLISTKRLGHKVEINGIPGDIQTAERMAREKPFDFEKWAITRISGMAPNSKQRNDGGIDGQGHILNAPSEKNLVLAQVKGGKFNLSHLRDFLGVFLEKKAAMGVYITLNKVTSRQAKSAAAKTGKFTLGAMKYPCVQLWSIEDYFEKREAQLPPMADPYTGKAMQPSLLFSR